MGPSRRHRPDRDAGWLRRFWPGRWAWGQRELIGYRPGRPWRLFDCVEEFLQMVDSIEVDLDELMLFRDDDPEFPGDRESVLASQLHPWTSEGLLAVTDGALWLEGKLRRTEAGRPVLIVETYRPGPPRYPRDLFGIGIQVGLNAPPLKVIDDDGRSPVL